MDFLKKLGIPLIALVFTFTLGMFATGCGGGRAAPGTNTISGQGSKGPFVKGSTVTAYELDSKGARTGNSETTKTTDDLGSYSLEVSWSGPTEVVIEGNYLDELTGKPTTTPQTLAAVEILPSVVSGKSNAVTANPNIVTAVAAKLAKTSLAKGLAVETAIESAKSSALSFLGLPTKDKKGNKIDPAKLNLSKTGDADLGDANAKLLAVSAAMADTFSNSTGLTDVKTMLESFATDIEKGNSLGTSAKNDLGATGGGGATIAAQIGTSLTTVNTSITTIVANLNKVITDAGGTVDSTLSTTLTTAVTDVTADVKTTLKGFTLSGNTISETSVSSGQTWTINSDGTTTVAGAAATGTAVTISGTIKDRTKDGTSSAGASSSAATFSFYIASTGDSRKISGSLSPVNIVVDSAGVVTVSVPVGADLTFSGTTTAGTAVSGTVTNLTQNTADTIVTTSSSGLFSINASNLLTIITNRVNNADLNVLQTAGTFNFEFGFSGIEIGHETAGSLDTLFPATSANVAGRVISGTIVTN